MKRGKGKRGLSAVVTTLIIILLSIVAIVIIWVVVRNVVSEGAGEINLERFILDIGIKSAYVDGSNLKVGIRRSAGRGQVTGVNFIFSDGSNSIIVKKDVALRESEERTFTFTSGEVPGIGAGDTVSVAPIFDSSGSEKTGDITDTETISANAPSGGNGGGGGTGDSGTGICGDFIIQNPNSNGQNEACDDGNTISEDGCSSTCQIETPISCNGVWDAQDVTDGSECDGTPTPNGCVVATCNCEAGFTKDGLGGCDLNGPINNGTINTVWNSVFLDSQDLPKSSASMITYIAYYVNFNNSPEIACFRIDFSDYVSETDISYLRLDNSLGFPNVASGESYFIWEAEFCGS